VIYFSTKLRENFHFASIFLVIYVDLGRPQVEYKQTCDATEKGTTRESQLVPGCRFPGLTAAQLLLQKRRLLAIMLLRNSLLVKMLA